MRNREPWYESENPTRVARGGAWRIALFIIAAIVLSGAITAAVWAIKVGTSGVRGAGDQQNIVNDGRNRVNSQEWFQGQYAQILAADKNLDEAAKNLAADPNNDFWRTNYTGLKNRCVDMVSTYNGEAGKVSRGQWRSPNLPEHIGDSDPRADCEPTKETTP